MHIRIANDKDENEAVLCIERGHNYARILYSEPEHIRALVSIAQSLGALMVIIEVEASEVESLKEQGFDETDVFVMMRRINGPKSKRG